MIQRMRKRPWMLPAMLLVLVFAVGLILEAVKPLGSNAATVGAKWVDEPTDMKYEEALGSSESTRYSGRVWADKTVYKNDVDLGLEGEINDTISLGDDDFLIGYSLLAATTVVSGQSVVPLDVVFVIDLSTSMVEQDKIGQTVLALNQAVKTLMNGHPDTRVAVVTYSTEASVLLPLDHYGKAEGQDYFSLTGEGEDQVLWAHVVGSDGTSKETSAKMSGWTNIHMAMDTGMDLLLNAEITTSSGVARHPALMLMSDGAPTCAGSNESSWWDPQGVEDSYFGPDTTGTYTLRTVMNAAYQKQQVTKHYGMEMQVYTVGVGVDSLDSETDRAMAAVTLNPETGLNLEYADELKTTWETYLSNDPTKLPELGGYQFNHPAKEDDISSLYYNDGYFSAKDANEIAGAFEQVLDEIIVTGAVPTEVGADPKDSGYITYTDPIGKYMEVKDVKALAWANTIFWFKTVTEEENVTTYVFSGNMTSPVYGTQKLSEITISVTTNNVTKDQTLVVKVPAAIIPLRVNTVSLNDDGTVFSNECKNDTPLRIFYTVGMRNDVLTSQKKVDLSKIDSKYVEEHTTTCGDVLFYSNLYTGNTEDQAGVTKTVGNATVTFVPADTNPFYFNQADTLVYADPKCTTPATPGLSTVYIKVPYYDGTTSTFDVVERSTSYNPEDLVEGKDGYLYLKAGSPCNLSDRIIDKGKGNATQTAETYHYPVYTYADDGSVSGISLSLGNNGALKAEPATGDLTISKTVTGNMGETDRGFVFDITVYHTDDPDDQNRVNLNGTYVASASAGSAVLPSAGLSTETNAQPTTESEASASPSVEPTPSQPPIDGECPEPSMEPGQVKITFVDGKAQVVLSHGQSITIHDLPAGYTYVVTEQDPNPDPELNIYNGEDYVVSITQSSVARGENATEHGAVTTEAETSVYTCTGSIEVDAVETVAYTNKLEVPMVDFQFTKVDGLDFNSKDLAKVTALSGAEFVLYHYDGTEWDTDSQELLDLDNPNGVETIWEDSITARSQDNGEVLFEDLQAGHYRLIETSAPDGYQLPDGQWNITVTISGEENNYVGDFEAVAVGNPPAFSEADGGYYLMNYKPINPPITGGDGGKDFRIGGGVLMLTGMALAAWWMQSSPRKRREFL